jgi:hypothetical protein
MPRKKRRFTFQKFLANSCNGDAACYVFQKLSPNFQGERFRLLRLMRMLISAIHIQLADHLPAELALWEHA